jgi:hypothetical protein
MECLNPSEHLHRHFVLALYFQLVYTATEYKRHVEKSWYEVTFLDPTLCKRLKLEWIGVGLRRRHIDDVVSS